MTRSEFLDVLMEALETYHRQKECNHPMQTFRERRDYYLDTNDSPVVKREDIYTCDLCGKKDIRGVRV